MCVSHVRTTADEGAAYVEAVYNMELEFCALELQCQVQWELQLQLELDDVVQLVEELALVLEDNLCLLCMVLVVLLVLRSLREHRNPHTAHMP